MGVVERTIDFQDTAIGGLQCACIADGIAQRIENERLTIGNDQTAGRDIHSKICVTNGAAAGEQAAIEIKGCEVSIAHNDIVSGTRASQLDLAANGSDREIAGDLDLGLTAGGAEKHDETVVGNRRTRLERGTIAPDS